MMPRSAEEIATLMARKANAVLLELAPEPTCATAKQAWRFKVERAKKLAAGKIWPESAGITIDIKV